VTAAKLPTRRTPSAKVCAYSSGTPAAVKALNKLPETAATAAIRRPGLRTMAVGRVAQITPALLYADAARRQAPALARCSLAGGDLG
jgi:hypothetical protein